MVLPRHVNVIMPINSYTKILHHAGYDLPERLAGLITAWQNLYQLIDPDIIILDYSPTAMLAARNLPAKSIAIGTGFHLPPDIQPIPILDSELKNQQQDKEALAFEQRVFGVINGAMQLINAKPLEKFTDLLDADEKILRTLPEMDHYATRKGARYAGIMKSPPGAAPQWPEFPGPKIFAYLKSFETLPNLLTTLNTKQYPTLIYGDKIPDETMQQFSSDTLHFVPRPLDMDTIGKTADVAICNAGHGTTTELLLSGVPLLLLPLNAEQTLVANNVERLGAGLSAPHLHPGGMEYKLNTLLTDHGFRDAAKKFANHYSGTNVTNLTDSLLDIVNAL